MSEFNSKYFKIFSKYIDVSYNSWTKILDEEARAAYIQTNEILKSIVQKTVGSQKDFKYLITSNFYPKGGVRNNRPKDLWCSIINKDSERFVNMPQIFMIASHKGIELGFSASIHPSDFSDQSVKKKLKEVIPSLFKLIPSSKSRIIKKLKEDLSQNGEWYFKEKTRLVPKKNDFKSLEIFIDYLKSPKGLKNGAGSISKFYLPKDIENKDLSLEIEFKKTFEIFSPLMKVFQSNYDLADELLDLESELNNFHKEPTKPSIVIKEFEIKKNKLREERKVNDDKKTFTINRSSKDTSFTGRKGEDLVFEHEYLFLKDTPYKDKIVKHYEIINDKPGWDITSYDLNGNKIFIEVKSTKQKSISTINVTSNELKALKDRRENYYIYLVTNVYDEKQVNIEKIKNPFNLIDNKTLKCEPSIFTIDLRQDN
jgi:hypothetical protein